jgi:hypothetical protein
MYQWSGVASGGQGMMYMFLYIVSTVDGAATWEQFTDNA